MTLKKLWVYIYDDNKNKFENKYIKYKYTLGTVLGENYTKWTKTISDFKFSHSNIN